MDRTALYRTIWRWHFYAALFVIPFVLVLSITGAFYLFKPQVDHWEERAWQGLPTAAAVSPDAQVQAALAAFPGARLDSYRLPEAPGDAALVHVALPHDKAMRDVFVSPQGRVVGSLDPDKRLMAFDRTIHGQLLLGRAGSWLVELAASWAIVMILTGLYLWWPSGRGLTGVVWPRLASGHRLFWRDMHAVAGFWVAGLALVMLLTGLPWADAWGSAFQFARTEAGWVKGKQDWTIGGKPADAGEHALHADHDHAAMAGMDDAMPMAMSMSMHGSMHAMSPVSLSEIVARARGEHLAFPVLVVPSRGGIAWTVKSDTQDRPLRISITYDAITGAETGRETFAQKQVLDRVVAYGVAWHEGQLFGVFNQLVGVATAVLLIALVVSGFVMWRRRKPEAALGAPPLPPVPPRIAGVAAIVLLLAALLPLLAASLVLIWTMERAVLARIPAAARWLGLRPSVG